MRVFKICVFLLVVIFSSCDGYKTAIVWTDRPEFALYGEFFNTVQNQYKVSIRYIEFPATRLARMEGNADFPDLVVGSWLKNSQMSTTYQSLNNLFGQKKLSNEAFYPRLLAMGRQDRTQYLLPVSFNIPALVFSKDRENDLPWFELSNQFTIDFNEIKRLSRPYNRTFRGAFTRMGFSPLWDDDFLFTAAVLNGASFREDNPLGWDSAALERSLAYINNWANEINSNIQADDDFAYKYFIEPPERLIQSGRILFMYMESRDLFTLSDERKNNLDFRWIMENNRIPVTEDSVFLGIPKKAKSKQAARAFIYWFYKVESQRQLLDFSRTYRINENIFGICGGFSALNTVTEHIYPLFYPEILGRRPPSENFTLPNILPDSWIAIKERVVLPYLHDRARKDSAEDAHPLERRLSDWVRMNR
jgi:ABC-type glycerol-3-phosphate transport system substrate-binding protein